MTSPIESSSEDTDAAADVDKHSAYEAESEQEKVFFQTLINGFYTVMVGNHHEKKSCQCFIYCHLTVTVLRIFVLNIFFPVGLTLTEGWPIIAISLSLNLNFIDYPYLIVISGRCVDCCENL
jgi:hypothetical protein